MKNLVLYLTLSFLGIINAARAQQIIKPFDWTDVSGIVEITQHQTAIWINDSTPIPTGIRQLIASQESQKYQFLLVSLGQRNTGGYSIANPYLINSKQKQYLMITEKAPARNCMTTEALTYPAILIRFDKKRISSTKKLLVRISKKMINCP
jgi:hypothetical protein